MVRDLSDLSGRTVLVTGATAGVGLASARRLLERGARVIVSGRSPERIQLALDELGAGEQGIAAVGDLTTEDGASGIVRGVGQAGGKLDGLVLAQGYQVEPQLFVESDPARFAEMACQVFLANAFVVHALLPALRSSVHGARIVQVTSDASRYPTTGEVMIGALDAANVMLMRGLARELARDRIRMNAVTLTITRGTPSYDRAMGTEFTRQLFEKAEARMPHGPIDADDVAATVTYLMSDAAQRVTGQIIGVTGGLSI